jgi:hypothetical protein
MPTISTSTTTSALGTPCQRAVELVPAGAYLAAVYEGTGTEKLVFRRRVDSTWSAACGSSGPNSDGSITARKAALVREGSHVHVLVETYVGQYQLKYIKATWNGSDDWTLGASLTAVSAAELFPSSSVSIAKDPQQAEYIAAASFVSTTKTYVASAPETSWSASTSFANETDPALVVWNGNIYLFTSEPTNRRIRVRKRVNGTWSDPYYVVSGLDYVVAYEYSVAATEDALHLLYHELHLASDALVYMHSATPQTAWSDKTHVDEGQASSLHHPNLASVGPDLVAAWRFQAAGNVEAIRVSRKRGADWRAPLTVAPGPDDEPASKRQFPHLPPAFLEDDTAFQVVYLQGDSSPYNVRATTFVLPAGIPGYTYASRLRTRRSRR